MELSEFELIRCLGRKIPRPVRLPGCLTEDAGTFKSGIGPLVMSTDVIVDGVDFHSAAGYWEQIGRKALAVNLSDLAAMGAAPVCFTCALGIPRSFRARSLERVYQGLMGLARRHRIRFAKGDISRSKTFFIAVTVIGSTEGRTPVPRSGARPGDWLGVTGSLGGSFKVKQFEFEPRVREGNFLLKNFRPHAMIDISDGLLQDLGHLLRASGAGCRLQLDALPISAAARKAHPKKNQAQIQAALSDGEDFELLLTVAPAQKERLERAWKRRFPGVKLSWIGRIIPGKSQVEFYEHEKKISRAKFKQGGFRHF